MSRKMSVLLMLVAIAGMLVFIFSRWRVNLKLVGDEEITVPYGVEYADAGATADFEGDYVSAFDRDLDVKTKGEVDTNEIGTYTVRYRASSGLYHAEQERVVHVEDVVPPMLILEERPSTVMYGDSWSDGYSATDDHDGDLTDRVVVEGAVDPGTIGVYTIRYSVEDEAGNRSEAERVVSVVDEVEPIHGSKIVFLTFDDGPGEYTEELLDILAKHDAKVTFFVTGLGTPFHPIIKREFEEGHTVAVHTLTHSYSKVYESDEAYWADFEAMNDIIEEQTGRRANVFRFPGGSSNTVSSFNPGIMTRLAQEAAERGLQYFDWNVDSGDAGGVTTADGVYERITGGVANLNDQGYDVMVVLCHDIHKYTVESMDRVLTWFEENGYTLMPLKKGICTCQHSIAN